MEWWAMLLSVSSFISSRPGPSMTPIILLGSLIQSTSLFWNSLSIDVNCADLAAVKWSWKEFLLTAFPIYLSPEGFRKWMQTWRCRHTCLIADSGCAEDHVTQMRKKSFCKFACVNMENCKILGWVSTDRLNFITFCTKTFNSMVLHLILYLGERNHYMDVNNSFLQIIRGRNSKYSFFDVTHAVIFCWWTLIKIS